jgi:hypothetical protein
MHDALFRTNSAVILPEGEEPSNKKGGSKALTSVGLFATVLRYNEEHPSSVDATGKPVYKKLFIAGHTDTAGGESTNQPLSEERAKVALAILAGDRGNFAKLCQKRHDGVDLTQIFHWVADSPDFSFNCKPTKHDQPPSTTTVTHFKQAYDAAFDAKFKDMPGAKKFGTANGTIDEALWGAIFDCYEYGLCCELGDMETSTEGKDELKRLRGELTWVDDNHKTMGFGEKFPIDNVTKNDFRSQSNRRVEIMMFDDGEEPNLAEASTNPEIMETYLPGVYGKVAVKPMVSARKWRAEWDRKTEPLFMDDNRAMLLDAPGMPANIPVLFKLEARVDQKIPSAFTEVTQTTGEGSANAQWSDWFKEELATMGPDLNAGQAFPIVSFRFIARGAGRTVTSEWLDYADAMDVDLTDVDDEPIKKLEYLLGTPWGYRKGSSDDNGNVKESALPPGGSCLLGLKIAPVETNELPPTFIV